MATLVTFHAHPDDESIATGGTMMAAHEAGHRVVLVVATRGEHGEIVPGVLADGEQLGVRRVHETYAAAEVLGVDRVEFLGYLDSGMMGAPENEAPGSFWTADVDHAAARLALVLEEEARISGECVLTIYDEHGGYGHPDHIQVHRVGTRAAQLAGVEKVYQATMNRDDIRRNIEAMADHDPSGDIPELPDPDDEEQRFGMPESAITHAVDVRRHLDRKRQAMVTHASQIAEDSFFLAMPAEAFAAAFGTEWFIQEDRTRPADGPFETDLFSSGHTRATT